MLKLSGTSAAVMLWVQPNFYQSPPSQKYRASLDLSAGQELYQRIKEIWPRFGEVIPNRKYGIAQLLKRVLGSKKVDQMISLAAGLDPLSLESCSLYPHVKAFDVDRELMPEKEAWVQKIEPKVSKRIQYIETDLTSTDLLKNLKQKGWNPKRPTAIVLEGISYYLTQEELFSIFRRFATPDQHNFIMGDLSKILEKVSEPFHTASKKVVALLGELYGVKYFTRYDPERWPQLVKEVGGCEGEYYTMREAEKARTGKNELFTSAASEGVILYCFRI